MEIGQHAYLKGELQQIKRVVHSTLFFQIKCISEVLHCLNKYDLTKCRKFLLCFCSVLIKRKTNLRLGVSMVYLVVMQ